MAKTKIREDIHGPYVRTDGRLLRPVMPIGYSHANPDGTKFKVGEEVNARPVSGSPLGRVNDEVWYSHGNYTRGGPSSDYWKPDHERWP